MQYHVCFHAFSCLSFLLHYCFIDIIIMYDLFVVSINVLSCSLSCLLSFVPDLTLSPIDGHYSWDLHGITHMIFCNTTLLQMERETQSGDTGPPYAVPRTLAGPSGVRLVEMCPNSEEDTPCLSPPIRRVQPGDLPPACLERGRART